MHAEIRRGLAERWARLPAVADEQALASQVDLLRLCRRTQPALTAAVVVATVAGGLLPTAFSLASGATVGTLREATRTGLHSAAGHRLDLLLGLAVALFVAMQALGPLRETLADSLMVRVDADLARRIMRLTANPPGVAHLEDPALVDRLEQAKGAMGDSTAGGAAYNLVVVWLRRLGGVTALIVLASFRWWLVPIVVANQLVVFRWRRRNWAILTKVVFGRSDALRRAAYLRRVAIDASTAKETRVFGLDRWLVDCYRAVFLDAMASVWALRRRSGLLTLAVAALVAAVHGAILVLVVRAGLDGSIGIGRVVVYIQAAVMSAGIGSFSQEDGKVADGLASLAVLQDLEAHLPRPDEAVAAAGLPVDGLPRGSIRFESVGFTYPGRDRPVFDGLELELEAGRSTAVVGENGAGKTTLIKLLAGLYEPTVGRITIDGIDLRDLDRRAWQRRVAAIFQDFVQYRFSAYDNVAVGALERAGDAEAVHDAARRAGAAGVVERLAHGWDTVLGRQFTEGADLSGGEWQRLALARALFAVAGGAGVLVLDEPTASLDVRAEAELYDRFLDLTADVTTVVISHRFSTVRRADRIVFLEHGRIVEDGSHDELVAAGGRYAELYALQASRFASEEGGGRG
jgi:ATP-binding cassette, subfamily B, bacterial